MRRLEISRLLAIGQAFCQLVISVFLIAPGFAHAQTKDLEPPVIEFEALEQGLKGDVQVFSATVTDDQQVAMVVLHYRFSTDSTYQSVEMHALANTSIYSTSVDTEGSDTDVIQYYIEARDQLENRSLRGFAFDPLERELVDSEVLISADSVPNNTEPMSRNRKILYGVLGLVVVGALLSASGGGDSSSSGSGVPVTFVVNPLPTGQ